MKNESLFNNPFEGMSVEKLLNKKALYETLIREQSPNYDAPISRRTGKKIKPPPMAYMVPQWQKGLSMVDLILKSKEVQSPTT